MKSYFFSFLFLFFSIPTFAVEKQWETLKTPPGAETNCERLFEQPGENSFTRDWGQTEKYLSEGRNYETVGTQKVRLGTPKPVLQILFPSMTIPFSIIGSIENIQSYELRGFCPEVMNAATDPSVHLMIVTSIGLEAATVKNCIRLALMSKVTGSNENPDDLEQEVEKVLKNRIHFFDVNDSSPLPLSQKLLQDQQSLTELKADLEKIKSENQIPDKGVFMKTFVSTPQEGWVADALGASVWGNPLLNAFIESKSAYHELAEKAGITKADAEVNIFSENQLIFSIYALLKRNLLRAYFNYHPESKNTEISLSELRLFYNRLSENDKKIQVRKLMLKLNQGASGLGNAPKLVSENVILALLDGKKSQAIRLILSELLDNLKPTDEDLAPKGFIESMMRGGGVVEQFVPFIVTYKDKEGNTFAVSPSGQADVRQRGVTLMGCHEQKFKGGESEGVFDGAIYGWSRMGEAICQQVYNKTLVIGETLREMGYLGRFSVDYIVTKNPVTNEYEVVIIEVNARSGGTHTVDGMIALTSAFQYTPETATEGLTPYHWYAQIRTESGDWEKVKLYNEGTDNFVHPGLKLFCSDQELLDFIYQRDSQFWKGSAGAPMANSLNKRGILPHMIQGRSGSQNEDGKMGFAAIGHNSYEDAARIFRDFKTSFTKALDQFSLKYATRTCP